MAVTVIDLWPILFHLCALLTGSPLCIILKQDPDIGLFPQWAFECLQVSPNYKSNFLEIENDQKTLGSAHYSFLQSLEHKVP